MSAEDGRKEPTMEVLLDDFEDRAPRAPKKPPVAPGAAKPSVPPSILPPKPREATKSVAIELTRPARPATGAIAPSPTQVRASVAPPRLSGPPPLSPPKSIPAPTPVSAARKVEAVEEALRRATSPTDPLAQSRAFYEAATLAEERLGDMAWALDLSRQSMAAAPTYLPAVQNVRRLLIATGAYEDALPLFEAEARLTADPTRRAAVLVRKAAHLEDRLRRGAEARAVYLQARELDRRNAIALRELLRPDWEGTAGIDRAQWLEELAALSKDDANYASELHARRARTLEKDGRLDAAVESYRRALELDAHNVVALEALKRLLAKSAAKGEVSARTLSGAIAPEQRAAWLIDVLAHEIAIEQAAARRTRLRLRLADLLARDLDRNEDALRVLEEALDDAPADLLEEVLSALAEGHERARDVQSLAAILERWADRADGTGTRIALYLRMAEAHLGTPNGKVHALRALERAQSFDATHVPTLQGLGALYTSEQRWDALIRMHLAEAEATRDGARRAAAHARVADLFEHQLNQPAEAVAHHLRALSAHPDHVPSFHALSRLYRVRGQHRELLELHRRALDGTTDPARRIALLLTMGGVHEDLLNEADRAIECYERVLEIDPRSRVAIAALERAGERAGKVHVVVSALDQEAALEADPSRKVSLLHKAGELLAKVDPQAAVVRYRRVLEVEGTHRPALASLGRLFHELGLWDDLLEIHRRELELAETPLAKSLIASTLAAIAEKKLGRAEEALGWLRRSFELDATNMSVARSLERLLRARGATSDLRSVLEAELQALTSAPPSAGLEARAARTAFALGEFYEAFGNEADKALAAYRKAKAGGQLRPDARDAIVRLLARSQRTGELVAEHEAEAAASTPARATALYAEAARLTSEELADTKRATALFESAIQQDPAALNAWTGLEDAQRRMKPPQSEALARALSGQAGALRDAHARSAALFALSRIQAQGASPQEARGALEMMLSLQPEDAVALGALLDLATRTNDPLLRERVEQTMAVLAQDPASKAAHLAHLARRAVERGEEATALWEEAFRLDPDNLTYARGLVRALEGGPVDAFARALRRNAALEPENAARAALHYRTAQVLEHADPAAAANDLEHALRLAPEREDVADALAHLLVRLGDPERAVDRLRRAAHSAHVLGHHARVARLQAEVLKDLPAATATLSRAASIFGEGVELLALQVEYLERDGQYAAAIDHAERLAKIAGTPAERAEALFRAGSLALHKMKDAARAEPLLQALHALHDARATPLLAESAFVLENFEEARDHAAQWANQAAGTPEEGVAWVVAMRSSLAMGDREGTVRAAVRAVVVEGSTGPARQAFAKVIAQSTDDRLPRLNALAQALRDHLRTRRGEVATYLDLAQLLGKDLQKPSDAADVVMEGLRGYPTDLVLRHEYVKRAIEAGRDRDAVTFAERRIAEAPLAVEAWSDLAISLTRSERLAWVNTSLALLGVDTRTAPAPRARWTSFPAELCVAMTDQDPEGPLVGILSALLESLPKLYPADLEGFGTSTREKLSTRSGHPLRGLFDRVAVVFGAPAFELFLHRVRGRGAAVELAEPTYFLMPAVAADLPEAGQIFLAARSLALQSARLSIVDKLTPRELEILVASAVRIVVPGFGTGLTSEDVIDDQSKRIARLLSRKARRTLEELAPRYAAQPVTDYPALVAKVQRAAGRVGLLLSDDLASSIDAMRRIEREGQGQDFGTFLRASQSAQDLMRFHCSEQAVDIRRRFGGLG
jgi:tetratricopeptide (TPR) repeat protein